jgi:hypothetical protein
MVAITNDPVTQRRDDITAYNKLCNKMGRRGYAAWANFMAKHLESRLPPSAFAPVSKQELRSIAFWALGRDVRHLSLDQSKAHFLLLREEVAL